MHIIMLMLRVRKMAKEGLHEKKNETKHNANKHILMMQRIKKTP